MASYDLSATVFPFLTPHLLAPLLKTLQEQKVYPEDFLVKQRNAVLSQTRNYTELITLAEAFPKIITENKKQEYIQNKNNLDDEILILFQNLGDLGVYLDEVILMPTRDLQNLKREAIMERANVTFQQLTALQHYATVVFDAGLYLKAAVSYLVYYLVAEVLEDGQHQITKPIVWSMVEAALLSKQHHIAILEVFLKKLRDLIDLSSSSMTLAAQSKQRATYLAFVLYAFTTDPPANALLSQRIIWSDMIFSQTISSTQLNSSLPQQIISSTQGNALSQFSHERLLNSLLHDVPSLFRYVVLSTIIAIKVPHSPTTPWLLKKSPFIRELTRIIQIQFPGQNSSEQNDPLIKFFQQVVIEFDFSSALDTLHNEVSVLFKNDPFLQSKLLQLEFYESAKAILIDTVLRLNTNINVTGLNLLLPLKIDFPGFENTITLLTKETTKENSKDASKSKDTTVTGTESKDTVTPEVGPDGEPIIIAGEEVLTPEVAETTGVAVPVVNTTKLVSPLLARNDFHSRIMKKLKPQQQTQQQQEKTVSVKK